MAEFREIIDVLFYIVPLEAIGNLLAYGLASGYFADQKPADCVCGLVGIFAHCKI